MSIFEKFKEVKERKDRACIRVGRDPDDVLLMAVTKTHPASMVNEAIAAGATDIGENKAQELVAKYDEVDSVRWHFIGHLQTNKVKDIISKVTMIHSLDSERLAKEIDKRAGAAGIVMDALVEINVAMEKSKPGILLDDAEGLVTDIENKYNNVRVRGLMCVPPISEDPEESRPYFKEVKTLFDEIRGRRGREGSFDILSMGMSGDFEVAIEEGSTIVRVGSAIFGPRNYK